MERYLTLSVLTLCLFACSSTSAEPAETMPSEGEPEKRSIDFFADGLDRFEIWMGVPHHTVKGLPEGTAMSKDGRQGTPLGLGNVKNVFSMIEEDGQPVLKITGEIYGGLTTLESFADYHLTMQFKWGQQKWEPRLKVKRDSGLLYHCQGEHGAFWNVWKSCLEFQVQEKDMGDFIGLAGPKARVRLAANAEGKRNRYDPQSEVIELTRGYTHASAEPDYPNGRWNTLDLYVLGDRAVHVVNGEIVFALFDAVDGAGKKLERGQIQIQSEAAECYYRGMVLTRIEDAVVPDAVAELLKNP